MHNTLAHTTKPLQTRLCMSTPLFLRTWWLLTHPLGAAFCRQTGGTSAEHRRLLLCDQVRVKITDILVAAAGLRWHVWVKVLFESGTMGGLLHQDEQRCSPAYLSHTAGGIITIARRTTDGHLARAINPLASADVEFAFCLQSETEIGGKGNLRRYDSLARSSQYPTTKCRYNDSLPRHRSIDRCL